MLEQAGNSIIRASDLIWGYPVLLLLLGGGLYFLIYSGLTPLRHIGHALAILTGKYDKPHEQGQIDHYQALSTALAGTVGMGNISGVAIAITMGGPGAIFWMWISALLGISTKYFECTLAVLFRGRDSNGTLQGGPMYFITEGLGKRWKPMAIFFSIVGMIGVSPLFQANQLTRIIGDVILESNNIESTLATNLITGIVIALLVAVVIIGGIKRIGNVTGRVVPVMVILYMASVFVILFSNFSEILPSLKLIIVDAFTGEAVMGGTIGGVIITGVRRAAFSNEAGLGTAPMAHGAAKTDEPVREGLVAMLGPIIDTIIICTLTALAIIITGVWHETTHDGITLTTLAFESVLPVWGKYILTLCVLFFSMSTMFAFPYYGTKCLGFVAGAKYQYLYNYFFLVAIIIGAVSQLRVIVSFIDIAFALMAIPTIISAVLLSPHVKRESITYFRKLRNNEFQLNKRRKL
jgi:alanine or glycine:cation symporter, AGCS family